MRLQILLPTRIDSGFGEASGGCLGEDCSYLIIATWSSKDDRTDLICQCLSKIVSTINPLEKADHTIFKAGQTVVYARQAVVDLLNDSLNAGQTDVVLGHSAFKGGNHSCVIR